MAYFPPQQTAIQLLNKIKTVDGSGSGLDADTIDGLHANELSTVATLNDLTDVTISTPSTNQVLLYNGSIWVNGTITSGATDHGDLTGLTDDDHSQYLLANGTRSGASSSRQVFTNGITTGSIRPSSDSTTALQLQNAAGTAVVTVDTTNQKLILQNNKNLEFGSSGRIPYIKANSSTFWEVGDNVSGKFFEYSPVSRAFACTHMESLRFPDAGNLNILGDQTRDFVKIQGAGHSTLIFNHYGEMRVTYNNGSVQLGIDSSGRIFVGQSSATALLDLAASTTTRSSLRIRSGVAPTSPNDGDIWFDGTNFKCSIAGVTKTFTVA